MDDAEAVQDSSVVGLSRAAMCRRFIAFAVSVLLLIAILTVYLTPAYPERGCVRGMYRQPRESIEVAVFGASSSLCGISPCFLYEEYGLSSYNLSSSNQSYVTSYHLLLDLLKRQEDSLKIILVDAKPLITDSTDAAIKNETKKALTYLSPFGSRSQFAYALTKLYSGNSLSENLVPLLRFHSRWNQVEESDLERIVPRWQEYYTHGQYIFRKSFWSNTSMGAAGTVTDAISSTLTPEIEADVTELKSRWDENSLGYLEKMCELCDDKGIKVVMIKTPAADWSDEDHDSVQLFANEHDLEFLDMTASDVWNQLGMNYDDDYRDMKHTNLLGSLKVTNYLGEYLQSRYSLTDMRNTDIQPFSEDDLQHFDDAVYDCRLLYCTDLEGYLDLIDNERYTVFIASRGDVASSLSSEARQKLDAMGLHDLASLSAGASYVGVLEGGECRAELYDETGASVSLMGDYHAGILSLADRTSSKVEPRHPFVLKSCAVGNTPTYSVTINGTDYEEAGEGLKFVVFERYRSQNIDTSSFDVANGSVRNSDTVA